MSDGGERPLVAVLDYGIGNLRSAQKALEHVGADARLTADHGLIADAAAVVLPGVGAFGACVSALDASGLSDVAVAAALDARPFLGICVGMQLLFEGSDEAPEARGLGVFPGRTRLLPAGVKRPQMQWNRLQVRRETPLLTAADDGAWMYFVHSYAADTDDDLVTATCEYGGQVTAMVGRPGCWATQFHPEKSARSGLAMLAAFVDQVGAVVR
jgi:imidazole glycerol-phosphate synthase subunit HisH